MPSGINRKKYYYKLEDIDVTAAKPHTKAQLVTELSEKLDTTKKDVTAFLEMVSDIARKETKRKRPLKRNQLRRRKRNNISYRNIELNARMSYCEDACLGIFYFQYEQGNDR